MKIYKVNLKSEISKSFFCTKAANSLDIDVEKKSEHNFEITADIETKFNVGLICGSSGSGKITLAKKIFGENIFEVKIDENKPVIDQFPDNFDYDQRSEMLAGIGLTSVITWIRPIKTLSNGQKARAESALLMASSNDIIIIDEWTSVVDRTVAKVMSHCVQKFARKFNKKIILLSCHYDVADWLQPCWVIDCNTQNFEDRRLLRKLRNEKLEFTIKEIGKESWKYFSKYHYLSEKLPGGKLFIYGLFHGQNQIGFQCYANYCPHSDKTKKMVYHSNRTVIHPDYAGLSLGIKLINETAKIMSLNFDVFAAFSSIPIFKSMIKQKEWKLKAIKRDVKSHGRGSSCNKNFMRTKVKLYSFKYTRC